MPRHIARTLASLFLLFLLNPTAVADSGIRALTDELARQGRLVLVGVAVENMPLLQHFYRARNYQPAWGDTGARERLRTAVEGATADGLLAADYYQAALERSEHGTESAGRDARDLLYTAALIRLASHHLHGKLNPADYQEEIDLAQPELETSPADLLELAINGPGIEQLLDHLSPTTDLYHDMKRALARYRDIAAAGGWPAVSPGPTLHPGDTTPRVIELRARLAAEGYTLPAANVPEYFDDGLAETVRLFQTRHQLGPDGLVGKQTLAALNVPASARVDQIRVNLERARWLLHDVPDSYVLVDIAGFEVRFVREGKLVLRSRAVVGKPYRSTPIFRAAISYMDFHPTWTVPPTILTQDLLPEVREDLGYLERKHMRVLTLDGEEVDPAGVDWGRYNGRNLPYLIRQAPGPDNPLGRVKFMFPNTHSVYLHDTPSRELFRHSQRAFSSGCIRVEQAAQLAELLLAPEGWSAAEVGALLSSGERRRVRLQRPVPVLLYYWTATMGQDGWPVFKPDVYNRDRQVLAGLDRLPPEA